ncbi:DUF962 domain-containing protein [Uruburuella testudinis]|uniref:DUF962 domain-containing protein n=1 Tax=Uruburuella testudinis TaxID=1282863 RepID=A0ABY4DW73_9NEIS|nr:Mpo1-like protein [Uruburuella testudinis]UOO82964.1 DUF962 domain-containing protein [Uruburuella testudinis]
MQKHSRAVRPLSSYAAYHRDKRNIASHFIGIPLIWLAIAILLARPAWFVGGVTVSPLLPAAVLLCIYYFRLHRTLGWLMLAVMLFTYQIAAYTAMQSTGVWLTSALAMFAAGWVIQFVGHYYEQKKPAFFDDIRGLIIGPVFMMAEACFMLGRMKDLQAAIEAQVGPAVIKTRPNKAV